jgi:hypothetical protein
MDQRIKFLKDNSYIVVLIVGSIISTISPLVNSYANSIEVEEANKICLPEAVDGFYKTDDKLTVVCKNSYGGLSIKTSK